MAKGGDFSKRKQKVGKKKLAPTSATSTRFHAKSVSITAQSVSVEKHGPTSARHLTAAELLAQLHHYSDSVRHGALGALTELLGRHADALLHHAPLLLERAALLASDASHRVRVASHALLRAALPTLRHAAVLGAHEAALALWLQALLSHPDAAVRADALPLLQLMLQHCPSPLAPPPPPLLGGLADLLATAPPASSAARPHAIFDGRLAILAALRALVRAQRRHGGAAAAARTEWAAAAAPLAAWRGAAWGVEAAARSREGLRGGGGGGGGEGEGMVAFPPLLMRCWLEAAAAAGDEAGGGRGAALECAAAVVGCCRALWLLEEGGEEVRAALLPLLRRHVAPQVPVEAHPAAGKAEEEALHRLNVQLVDLFAHVLPSLSSDGDSLPSPQPAPSDAPALRVRLVRFLVSQLDRLDGERGAAPLLAAASLLLRRAAADDATTAALHLSLLALWQRAPPTDGCRLPLLRILAAAVLPPRLAAEAAAPLAAAEAEAWVRSLPRLLWEVGGADERLAEEVLRTLVAVGRGGGGMLCLAKAIEPYFCARPIDATRPPVYGPYVQASPKLRRLALHLLHFLQPLPASLLASLARCGAHSPHLVGEIALAVESAGGEAASVDDQISMALTLATNVGEASGAAGEGWGACVGVLRRLIARHGEGARLAICEFCRADVADGESSDARVADAQAVRARLITALEA
ncbi:hypothetical protein AB1Y20_023616 [Prymnesium parvum]|uniref:Pre-rRNA-processing protein Ipi1 N-terminal domain-containing protein n=1 Tax=Prymnesium parvum TaxID=97485 RepID=A0AB34JF25_PRYPA